MITNKSSVIRLGGTQAWSIKSFSLVWFQYHMNARLKFFFQKYFDDKFFQNRGISFSHVLLKFFSGRLQLEVFLHDSKLYDFYSTKPSHKAISLVKNFCRRRFYRKIYRKIKKVRRLGLRNFQRKRNASRLSLRLSSTFFRRSSFFFVNSKNKLICGMSKFRGKSVVLTSSVESLFKKSYFFKKRFWNVAKWTKFVFSRLQKKRKVKLFKPIFSRSAPIAFKNFRYNYLLARRRSKLVDFLEHKSRKRFKRYLEKKQKFFSNFFRKSKRFGRRFNRFRYKNKKFNRYNYRRKKYFNKYKKRARRRVLSRFYKFYARRRRLIIRHFTRVARLRLRKLYTSTLLEVRNSLTSSSISLSPIFRRFMLKRIWLQYLSKKKLILKNLASRKRFKILYLRSHPYLRRWGLQFFGKKKSKFNVTKKLKLTKKSKQKKKSKVTFTAGKVNSKKQKHSKLSKKQKYPFAKKVKFNKKPRFFSNRKRGKWSRRRGAVVTSFDSRSDKFVFFNQYSAYSSPKFIRYRFYHFLAKFLSAQIYKSFKLPVYVNFNFFPIHRAGSDFYLNYITAKLYYRYILSDIIKPIVKMSIAFYRGFVVSCKGRFTRAQIAVSKKFVRRSVSYSRISSLLDYGQRAVVLKYGTCNLRIWIRK